MLPFMLYLVVTLDDSASVDCLMDGFHYDAGGSTWRYPYLYRHHIILMTDSNGSFSFKGAWNVGARYGAILASGNYIMDVFVLNNEEE